MAGLKLKGLDKTLKKFRRLERAIPRVNQLTVDGMAFETRKAAIRNIEQKFTLRNKWTLRNIVFQKAKKGVKNPEAEIGSRLEYMKEQEFGQEVRIPRGVPLKFARTSKDQKKLVRRINRLNRLGEWKKISGRNAAIKAIKIASRKKSRSPLRLDINGKDAVYVIDYRSNKPTLKMLYNLTKKTVRIKAKPWLEPAVKKTLKRGDRIFAKNLNFFLKN